MTNEEAIKNLQDFTGWFKKNKPIYEALEMAIKALSQEPTDEMVHVETLRQVMWERDIAIGQLKELGYGFGQKIEPCDDNRLYIKVYADLEPQEKAEKLYQICEKEELLEVYKELGEYCEIEPCNDAVSRQAVLDCATLITSIPTEDWDIGDWVCLFRDRVSQLSPVTQEPKIGHWIEKDNYLYVCSECGQYIYSETEHDLLEFHAFCGRCGAKMESEENNG